MRKSKKTYKKGKIGRNAMLIDNGKVYIRAGVKSWELVGMLTTVSMDTTRGVCAFQLSDGSETYESSMNEGLQTILEIDSTNTHGKKLAGILNGMR